MVDIKAKKYNSIGISKAYSKKRTKLFNILKEQWELQLIAISGFVWMAIFCFIPMIGIVIAFKQYNIISKISTAPWVGFEHFIEFFNDENFFNVLKNTLGISFFKLIISTPIPIIFAILLNEVRNTHFKKVVQTVSYLPHFLSWVIIGGIMTSWLSESGLVNNVLKSFGMLHQPIAYLTEPKFFWGIVITSDIWQDFGWSSIIYFAAIASIEQTYYEAADIDGAGRFGKILNITIPSILPTIMVLFILKVGYMMNTNFDQILVLANPLNASASDVIDVFVYRMGITMQRFSYSTAVGLTRSVVALILLVFANTLSKKFTNTKLF